ncbi:opioid-binding protein/cell adhesion molecule homolog isoform X8 [Ostrea edulis]|uniref:opioid-binding protein/cell adhesion molecule homolog isoform X8 n=1 Tax=Ostrea edulis TaxID=37623 RepID=UPI0024AF9663|nr:opioid-binding protein/cell adhesion molecule homolog isoform X8 [Ostrea edulis]
MEVSEILIFTEIALCFLGTLCKDIMAVEPRFDVPIVNITVVAGKTAVLPCSIESLGEFKVVWTDQYSTLLTLAEKRIIDDERMVLDRPHTKDWNLLLHDVKYEDRGRYTCQINTLPIKTKTIELIVLVPPEILDTSSNDLTTKEGDTVTLTCNVTGIPRPTVQWFRKPHADSQEHHKERVGINGEILIIHNVSRYCDGIYECVAFNDVPPAVNRVISVMVEFPPEVWLNNKKMSQSLGKETILECKVTAFPQAVSVWRFENVFLANSLKHRIDIYKDKGHTIILSVRIMNITKEDFGQYSCFASNEFGEDEETMTLLEFNPPTKPRPVTTTEVRIFTTTPKTRSKLKSSEYDDFIPFKRNEGISHNRGNETFVDGLQFGIKCTGAIVRICAPYSMGKSNAGQTSLYYNGKLLISLIILFNFIIDIFYLV